MIEEPTTNKWDKNQPPAWMWSAIIGVVILIICGISSLIYFGYQTYTKRAESNNQLATQVARDKLIIQYDLATQAAAAATAVVAEQVEIRNESSQWPMVLFDSFDNNANDWLDGDIDDEYTNMTLTIDGRYVWEAVAKQGFIWRIWPDSETASDFYLAVDVQNLTVTPESYYGLIFRNNDGAYYFFEVWDSQNYRALYFDGNQWEILIPYTFSAAIKPGEINRLEVAAKDDTFYFFINNEFLGQTTGSAPSNGEVGVAIGLSNAGDEVTIAFDNFEYRVP